MTTENNRNFHRSIAIFQALASLTTGAQAISWQEAALKVGNYKSRGKGKGETKKSRHGKHMDSVRRSTKLRNIAKRKS